MLPLRPRLAAPALVIVVNVAHRRLIHIVLLPSLLLYTAAADAYLLPLTKCSYCSYPQDDQK